MSLSKEIWITYLGQTIYESINPFWAYCENRRTAPAHIILCHPRESKILAQNTCDALLVIAGQYATAAKKSQITPVDFDDENIQEFCKKINDFFCQYCINNNRLVVDVSPTSWSFIPTYLMRMARKNRPFIRDVIYCQYVDHASRQVPYPLIPRQGILAHNLLNEFERPEV